MFSSSNLRAFCSDNVAADTTALTSLTPTPPLPISRSCAHARCVCAGVPIALTLALTFSDVLHCAASARTLRQLRDSCAKWLMISSPEPSSGSSATLGPQRCRCAYQLRPQTMRKCIMATSQMWGCYTLAGEHCGINRHPKRMPMPLVFRFDFDVFRFDFVHFRDTRF